MKNKLIKPCGVPERDGVVTGHGKDGVRIRHLSRNLNELREKIMYVLGGKGVLA